MATTTQPGLSVTSPTNWAPTAKVSVGVLAGAISILICGFLTPHWKTWTGGELTPAIGAAVTNVLTFLVQYLMPERK